MVTVFPIILNIFPNRDHTRPSADGLRNWPIMWLVARLLRPTRIVLGLRPRSDELAAICLVVLCQGLQRHHVSYIQLPVKRLGKRFWKGSGSAYEKVGRKRNDEIWQWLQQWFVERRILGWWWWYQKKPR